VKCASRGSLKIQDAKNTAKIRHLGTIAQFCWAISSQLRHVSTIGKNLLNSNNLLQMSSQYGALTAEIGWRVWGTPTDFSGFRVLASLLHRRRLTEVNQTCTMFGRLLDWFTNVAIYTFSGAIAHNRILPGRNSLCVQILRFPILAALLHSTRAMGVVSSRDRAAILFDIERSSCLVLFLVHFGRLTLGIPLGSK